MKVLHIAFFFIFSLAIQAQTITNLNYKTTLSVDEVDIEFINVIEDSRCPKNVNCVRAGKAVVHVNIYVEGNFIEERRIEFYPSGFSNESVNTLFNSEGLHISGLNLMPYPVALSKSRKEDYFLELGIHYQ